MPVTKSAIKAMKQNTKARERNRATKNDFRVAVKAAKKDVVSEAKNVDVLASEAMKAIDKAAKKGVLHKKTAARRKSRLMLNLNKTLGKVVELKSTKTKKAKK